jgi:AraC family transcriptional activator of pobA
MTVQYLAEQLHLSTSYLSDIVRSHTLQDIHDILIEKAKERLSTTGLTVSEIACEPGFEHPQSFSKLFKTKTKLSPVEFRQSFN